MGFCNSGYIDNKKKKKQATEWQRIMANPIRKCLHPKYRKGLTTQ